METIALACAIGLSVAVVCAIRARAWSSQGQTLYRFFLLNGKLQLGGFVGAVVAANLSLSNFIVFITSWGYTFGLTGIFYFVLNLAMNFIGFSIFFRHYRKYIESDNNNGTIHDYLARTYAGEPHSPAAMKIRTSASLVTIVCLGLAMVFELSLAVQLLSPHNMSEQIILFAGLAILVAFFSAYGGMRTLVDSDIANALILSTGVAILAGFIGYFAFTRGIAPIEPWGSFADFRAGTVKLGWPNILTILVIGTGWMLVAMDQWQRVCAARSFSTSVKGMVWYFFILAAFALIFGLWGAFDSKLMPSLVPAGTVLSGDTNPLLDIGNIPSGSLIPHLAVMFVVSALVFAAVSTVNTFLTVCSHSLTTDVIASLELHKEMEELNVAENRRFVRIARVLIIAFSVVLIGLFGTLSYTHLLSDPLNFFFITYSVQFALLPSMVCSGFSAKWRPSSSQAFGSILLGFIVALGFGFGSWSLMQAKQAPWLGLDIATWLSLTPVITIVIGSLPLALPKVRQ